MKRCAASYTTNWTYLIYIGLTDIVYKYCLELNISIMYYKYYVLYFIDFLTVVNFLKWDMEMY